MNYNPCITIDVSQSKSHIQGFTHFNSTTKKPTNITQPKSMRHTKHGYNQILELINFIYSKTGTIPLIVFEYTGVYHKTLEKFLLKHGIKYHIVAPLRAAKSRKNKLRSVKTDKRDCLSLAKMFYNDDLGDFYHENEYYEELKHLNRFYENILLRQQELKVNFRELLAVIYPNFKISKSNPEGAFRNVYTKEALGFLKEFSHPDLVVNSTIDEIACKLTKYISRAHQRYLKSISEHLYNYCSNLISGCSSTSNRVSSLLFYIEQIEKYEDILQDTLDKIHLLVKDSYMFNLLMSIHCVNKNLASRFICEIGDILRFKSYKAIIAFVGTDSQILQSGDNDGLHKHITKKGNKHLRTILYLIVQQMTKAKNIESSIKSFYKKKTQQGLRKLVALIACCNKLIRIIYYMSKTGTAFE